VEKSYFPIKLPGDKLYSSEIEIRQFGPDEVAHYDRLKRSGSEIALRSLVGSTLKGIEIDDLYDPDLTYIMMWHRVNSFTHFPMKLPWECPTCEEKNNNDLDVTKVVSKEVPEDYDSGGMAYDLPCGLPVILRLQKVNDEIKARKMLSELAVLNPTEDMYRKAEMCMLMEYDENYNSREKWELVDKAFGVEDLFAIDGFKQEFAFGPSTVMNCGCKKCGGQTQVGFRFSIMEFLPSNLDGTAIRARILSARPTRADAKRAKDALLSKAPVASQETAKEVKRPRRGEIQDPAEPEHPSEKIETKEVSASEMMKKITPARSAQMVGKLLEEVRHEVDASNTNEPGSPIKPSAIKPLSQVVKGG
jgi:hypothetical protein